MENFTYRNVSMRYEMYGDPQKPAVVLLHGYLESLEIWENFVPLLQDDYHIICPDLPGHGKSGVFSTTHTMEEMAEIIRDLLLAINLKTVNLVGHSLGGYVALAFADLYDEYLRSCVLFHSSCLADSEEKRSNRNREIDLIRKGKKDIIVNTNVPMAFANDNLDSFSAEIERAKEIATATGEEGLIAILNGMKLRPDRCYLFDKKDIDFLLIAGKKDNYIPFDIAKEMSGKSPDLGFKTLENSGHMGFIEEREKAAEILKRFLGSEN